MNIFSGKLSIRHKITFGFYSMLLLVITMAIITYGIALQIESKVFLVEVIDDFYNMTLESRRFEKNYFLYGKEADFEDNQSFINQMHETLNTQTKALKKLSPNVDLETIESLMVKYQGQMLNLRVLNDQTQGKADPREKENIQNNIRGIGKKLTDFAHNTADAERRVIKILLKTTRTILVISAALLILFSLSMATFLGRKISSSLKLLVGYTQKISHGQLIDPPKHRAEEEIESVFRGFNKMVNELRLGQRQLIQSEKLAAMGTLVAGVAHELNNPLSNISTSVQIMTEELGEQDLSLQKKLLRQIEGQSDKARDIVKTLLEFSRTKEFKKERLFLRPLVESTVKLMRSEVKSKASIHLEVADDICIFADKQRMQQVLLNLIKNSLDAMGDNGNIWINAKFTKEMEPGSEVEIMIEDDGPGIEPEILQHIYDPFFTTKDVGKGSGLGLFVAHDIVEAHNGRITVDSRVDQGTTFIIWLPSEGDN